MVPIGIRVSGVVGDVYFQEGTSIVIEKSDDRTAVGLAERKARCAVGELGRSPHVHHPALTNGGLEAAGVGRDDPAFQRERRRDGHVRIVARPDYILSECAPAQSRVAVISGGARYMNNIVGKVIIGSAEILPPGAVLAVGG